LIQSFRSAHESTKSRGTDMTLAHAQAPCIGTQHRISFRGDYVPMGRVGSCEARDRRPPSGRLQRKRVF
jgi:hypothetical protein